jgi:hypothetical protein
VSAHEQAVEVSAVEGRMHLSSNSSSTSAKSKASSTLGKVERKASMPRLVSSGRSSDL